MSKQSDLISVSQGAAGDPLFIDTANNRVGIGTSSPAVKLTSQLASSGISGIASTAAALFENSGNSDVVIAAGASSKSRIAFGDSGDWIAGRIDYDHSDNSMRFGTAGSGDRLRIDASGRVGIGTQSPDLLLSLKSYGETQISFKDTGGTSRAYIGTDGSFGSAPTGALRLRSDQGGIVFGNSGAEHARIDTSGNLLVGTTTVTSTGVGGATFAGASLGRMILQLGSTSATAGTELVHFYNNNGRQGSIQTNASGTVYATSSDYRLKEDVQPMVGSVDRLMALKPVNFAWKVDGSRVDGFLAHEAQAVVPEAVSGTKDEAKTVDVKDEDGNVIGTEERPVYQGIDQSKLVPLLTAALQEALQKIDALETRISALETN
jgi:hypothetical protein